MQKIWLKVVSIKTVTLPSLRQKCIGYFIYNSLCFSGWQNDTVNLESMGNEPSLFTKVEVTRGFFVIYLKSGFSVGNAEKAFYIFTLFCGMLSALRSGG